MQLPIKHLIDPKVMFVIFTSGHSFSFGLGWNSDKALRLATIDLYPELKNFKQNYGINMSHVSIHNNFRDVIDNIDSLHMSEIRIYTMSTDFTKIELYASLKTQEDLINYNAKHPLGMTL